MSKLETLEIVGPVIKGDTWDGMEITLVENNNPIDLTNATITVDMGTKKFSSSPLGNDWTITITNRTGGVFRFDPVLDVDIPIGLYSGPLRIQFPNGTAYSYCIVNLTVTTN